MGKYFFRGHLFSNWRMAAGMFLGVFLKRVLQQGMTIRAGQEKSSSCGGSENPAVGPLTQAFEDARDRIIAAEMPKQLGYALKQQLRLWLTR